LNVTQPAVEAAAISVCNLTMAYRSFVLMRDLNFAVRAR
jgi:hypothetical protein